MAYDKEKDKLVRISTAAHKKLTDIATKNRRAIGAQLEVMIDDAWQAAQPEAYDD